MIRFNMNLFSDQYGDQRASRLVSERSHRKLNLEYLRKEPCTKSHSSQIFVSAKSCVGTTMIYFDKSVKLIQKKILQHPKLCNLSVKNVTRKNCFRLVYFSRSGIQESSQNVFPVFFGFLVKVHVLPTIIDSTVRPTRCRLSDSRVNFKKNSSPPRIYCN